MNETALNFETRTTNNTIESLIDPFSDTLIVNNIHQSELSAFIHLMKQYPFEQKTVKDLEFFHFTVNLALDLRQLLNQLLQAMGSYYQSKDCNTARIMVAASHLPHNATCAENEFEFSGRLTNESVVNGQLDSLNTWFKRLKRK
ncbi:hypothetical protein ACOYR1_17830 [Thalassotalea piscium]